MDFTATGALQQRPGSQTFVVSAIALTSTYYASTAGGLSPTIQTIQTGASFPIGPINSLFEFSNLSGSSYILFSGNGYFNYGSSLVPAAGAFTLSQVYYCTGGTFNYLFDPSVGTISPTDHPVNPNWCFANFVNRIFMCNGDKFYKWDGSTLAYWTLTVVSGVTFNPTSTYGYGANAASLTQVFPTTNSVYKYCLPPGVAAQATLASGLTAFSSSTFTYSYGYINDRGFLGPVSPPVTISSATITQVDFWGFSLGGIGFSIPSGYGIGSTGFVAYANAATVSGYQAGVAVYRDNGPGTGRFYIGAAKIDSKNLGPNAAAVFIDTGFPTTTTPEPTCIFATLPPQFIEIYNNQLFMCGFSQAPSTVQFSDIGEPESIQPQNNFDVRTNDGDFLTGLKTAFSQLFLFKNKSFHALSGTSPTNFALTPISDQYGCISNRAIATYQNFLLFLDKKGICMYNGAAVQVISVKLDPIFANMNLPAAQNNAWMLHYKERNQVWCGIPVNGSTMINQIIVYDYLLNAWTHFDGINAACAAMAFGSNSQRSVYYGGYSGYLGQFGTSLTSDAGNAITIMAKARFVSDMGQSVEKIWRRLFTNTVSSIGTSYLWNIILYANYLTAIAATFSLSGISLTARADFGISAKALSAQFIASTSTDILQFQGFTIESRYQRNT